MLKNNPCVAYTVITRREDGKLMFLVERTNREFVFPLTSYERSGTGLASVIEEIKADLKVDIDYLELTELINTIIEDQSIPLFVFNYQDDTMHIDELVESSSGLQWQVSDNFTDTLKKYEISGVPNFDQE